MFGFTKKSLLLGTIVAATLLVGASQADAFWGWGCYRPVTYTYYSYSPCYTPCYTSCYTPCYTPCYSSCCYRGGGWYVGYRPGPIRRAVLGPYRWYYGGSTSACCYTWDNCCVTTGTATVTTDAAANEPTPAERPAPRPADAPPPADDLTPPAGVGPDSSLTDPTVPVDPPPFNPGTTPPPAGPGPVEPEVSDPVGPADGRAHVPAIPTRDNSGLLVIAVPYDAKVYINDFETKTKGSRRQYVSYGLEPGLAYKYEIRAEVVRDGRLVTDRRTVVLTAGDREVVAFGFNPSPVEGLAQR